MPARRALAVAGGADDGGVDLELAGDAERRLGEVDLEPDQGVLAAAGARPRAAAGRRAAGGAAEEGVHDVGEGEARHPGRSPGAAEGSPPRSYAARFCGSLRAPRRPGETSLNRSWVSGSGLTSGCSCRARRR